MQKYSRSIDGPDADSLTTVDGIQERCRRSEVILVRHERPAEIKVPKERRYVDSAVSANQKRRNGTLPFYL